MTRLQAGAIGWAHTETPYAEVYVARGAGGEVIWDIDFDLNFFDFHWGLARRARA